MEVNVNHNRGRAAMSATALGAALILLVAANIAALAKNQDQDQDQGNETGDPTVEQGFAASPIPESELNLFGKDREEVGRGSYLVNAAADCNGCHSFPRFLRPGGPGSAPIYGDPYLDPPPQSLNGQLKANHNVKHFLAGGRCFGGFMARNLTPDDSRRPRGLKEDEFIKVMRTGADISCNKQQPPTYGGIPDGVCALPDPPGANVSYNPFVLQTMSWPTYHSLSDRDLKAIYAYLSALPTTTACNTAADGCAGFSGRALVLGLKSGQYAYQPTADCPNPPPPQ
jgi:hypothetical protein